MQQLSMRTESNCRSNVNLPAKGLLLALLVATIPLLVACGIFGPDPEPVGEAIPIRTPKPTFTPTPMAAQDPAAIPTMDANVVGNGSAPAPSVPQPANQTVAATNTTAKVVVNTPLVNARTGPGTEYDIVATVERGDEYEIVGRNASSDWWQVCCIDNTTVWIIGEYVDTDGPVETVPVSGGVGQGGSVAAVPEAAVPAANPSGNITFDLKTQEQFPEAGVVRIFAYIYSGSEALAGYTLRVTKDGSELPVNVTSFGGQPAFTWPFQDARQRHQNLKVEFPGVAPAGTWQVQLLDSTGQPAGPAATFTLAANDPQQELYVRYQKR